ncbi:MAG: P-loop NTPase [Caldilineaceae bacterium]|nr:P-loop NTPase [Caldilineaceae bacterium]
MQLAIVTEYEYRAQVVEQSLQERGWELLTCIGQRQPSQWLLQQPGLEAVLIDLDIIGAIPLLRELSQAAPHLPLIVLATPQRIVELQDAMLAGASNFAAFPIDPKQLIATLERARGQAVRPTPSAVAQSAAYAPLPPTAQLPTFHHGATRRTSKVIAVTSLKGGVGRSTLAANVAIALRQQTNKNVALLEAHQGLGHLALLLNLYPRHTIESLDGEANIDLDLLQGLLQNHSSGVRLLAAPMDPAQLVELPIEVWQRVVQLLKETADYVVIDTAAHADGLLSEILAQADDILLMTGSDIAGLRDARILLQSLRHETGINGQVHVVLNRAGSQGGIDEQIVQEQLREPVAVSIPEDTPLATFAFNRGVPFVTTHPRALMTRRVQALVEQLIPGDALTAARPQPQRSSIFSFLQAAR